MRNVRLLLGKDLRVLRRSPLLLGVLVAYPLLIAALVVLVAQYANAKPRVAFVDLDGLPEEVQIAGETFHVDRTIDRVAKEFKILYQKQPGPTPGSYSVDHSAGVFLFDPQGRLRVYASHGQTPQNFAHDLRELLRSSPG